jgi:hypothetical protein
LEDPGVDGRIILRWIFRMWGMDLIEPPQDRDRWREIENEVMNFRVPLTARNFLSGFSRRTPIRTLSK